MAFGWYHEAYIDSKGQLFVCDKAKLTSLEVEGIRDGARADMTLVSNLPRGTRVKQVAFTATRMFVLSHTGRVYMYRIEEHIQPRDEITLFGT